MLNTQTNISSILVIDDDPDDYELVSEAVGLIDSNIEVSYLDKCEDNQKLKNRNIDFILLDINMPVHDGFTWLKSIREKHDGNIPVVMYTNSASPEHITRSYLDGADLYFTKPDSFPKLIEGLKQLLNMDWQHPKEISQKFKQEGKFLAFTMD